MTKLRKKRELGLQQKRKKHLRQRKKQRVLRKKLKLPKNLVFDTKFKSPACSEAELLREVILDLLQPLQPILNLQVNPK